MENYFINFDGYKKAMPISEEDYQKALAALSNNARYGGSQNSVIVTDLENKNREYIINPQSVNYLIKAD